MVTVFAVLRKDHCIATPKGQRVYRDVRSAWKDLQVSDSYVCVRLKVRARDARWGPCTGTLKTAKHGWSRVPQSALDEVRALIVEEALLFADRRRGLEALGRAGADFIRERLTVSKMVGFSLLSEEEKTV